MDCRMSVRKLVTFLDKCGRIPINGGFETMIGMALILVLKYLFDDCLMMYFYSKVLGRRYALKVTIFFTFVWWLTQDFSKILVFLEIGFVWVDALQAISLLLCFLFAICLFKNTLGKRILASVWVCSLLVALELLSYIPGTILAGNFAIMDPDSSFTMWVILIQSPFEVIGVLLSIRLWKWIERIEWRANVQQLMWVILPLSQMCFLLHASIYYSLDSMHIPIRIYVGLLIGIIADGYGCYLFIRSNKKEKAEKELKHLKAQYELERVRYEELMKTEEEIQKLRHDYANYCMTIKNM